jgi:hypothetical protein
MPHWYTDEGKLAPATVPYADPSKGERAATIRDAKKQGWAPSVTTVIKVLSAPALTNWLVHEAIKRTRKVLLETPSWLGEPEDLLVQKVNAEEDTSKRDIGIEIHRDIERALKGKPYGNQDIVQNVISVLTDADWMSDGRPEVPFRHEHPLPFGGTVDLVVPECAIVDFKTKESLSDRMVYDEHLMQCAAYCQRFGIRSAANLFIGYDGDVELVEHSEEDLTRGWEMFKLALRLWYLQKRWPL